MDETVAAWRVMIVEDDALIALDLELTLRDAGFHVVGPVGRLDLAWGLVGVEPLDAVVLDVNLGGEWVFPLAELLVDRKIPFLFLTGYASQDLPKGLQGHPAVRKPCSGKQVVGVLNKVLGCQEIRQAQ